MQKKISFKSGLLVSTVLVAGVIISSDANSRNYRAGGNLPSIEINFSVIEKLKKKEQARISQEMQARNSAEARALAEELRRLQEQKSNAQLQQSIQAQKPEIVKSVPYYNIEQNPKPIQVPSNINNRVIEKPIPAKVNDDSIYDFTAETKVPLEGNSTKSNIKAEETVSNFLLPKLKPGTKLVKKEKRLPVKNYANENQYDNTFVHSNIDKITKPVKPVDIVNIPNNIDVQRPLGVIAGNPPKPIEPVGDKQKRPVNNVVSITGNSDKLPSKYDSFIKVTEVEKTQNDNLVNNEEAEQKSKISFFKFPKIFGRKEEPKPYENFDLQSNNDVEPINEVNSKSEKEYSFIKIKENNDEPSGSEFQSKQPEVLADVPNQLPNSNDIENLEQPQNEYIVGQNLENLNTDTSAENSKNLAATDKIEKQTVKDKIFGAFSKIPNIKKIFTKKEEEQNQVQEIAAIAPKPEAIPSPEKTIENKALIPVEVEELEKITHEDNDGPVYLDSVANLNDWEVPEDVAKKLNPTNKVMPEYVSSLGNKVQIVLPNRVDDVPVNNIVPKPIVKPTSKVATSKQRSAPVAKNKKVENIASSQSGKLKYKPTKSQLLSVNPVSEDKWEFELEKARLDAESSKSKKASAISINKPIKQDQKVKTAVISNATVAGKNVEPNIFDKKVNNTIPTENKVEKVEKVEEPDNKVLYLEDIAKNLKKQKVESAESNILANKPSKANNKLKNSDYEIISNKNDQKTSKVTELAGYQMVIPSEKLSKSSSFRKMQGPIRIKFKSSELNISKADNDRIEKIVSDAILQNKKLEIVSYAPSDKPENARIISLKRAIAVRAAMLDAGLASDMVNVHAAGVAKKENDENSINISFVN